MRTIAAPPQLLVPRVHVSLSGAVNIRESALALLVLTRVAELLGDRIRPSSHSDSKTDVT